jgi:hypothetical protein
MRRRTKPVPLARMDLNRLIRTLRQRSTSEWPRHVTSAFEVPTEELKVDRQTALDLLIAAVSAAHRCARAVKTMSRVTFEVGRSHPLERGTLTMRRPTKAVQLARMDLNRLIRNLRRDSSGS